MTEYEEFVKECEKIKTQNAKFLAEFENILKEKQLSPKTIKKHIQNIDFFINEFLIYYEPIPAVEGHLYIDGFLGDWFIYKASWASKTSIKENAASIKKFYIFLESKKLISKKDLTELKLEIKELLPEWLQILDKYDYDDNFC